MQVADQTAAKEVFESLFAGYFQRDLLVMKTNVSSAHYRAVANAAGIGAFPTYACALGGRMIPLEVELPRLIEAFNPAKFPWFKDEFVHPGEFKAV